MPIFEVKCEKCEKRETKLVSYAELEFILENGYCECGGKFTRDIGSESTSFKLKGDGWARDKYMNKITGGK